MTLVCVHVRRVYGEYVTSRAAEPLLLVDRIAEKTCANRLVINSRDRKKQNRKRLPRTTVCVSTCTRQRIYSPDARVSVTFCFVLTPAEVGFRVVEHQSKKRDQSNRSRRFVSCYTRSNERLKRTTRISSSFFVVSCRDCERRRIRLTYSALKHVLFFSFSLFENDVYNRRRKKKNRK